MALIGTSQAVDCPAYGLTVATFTHVASPTCAAADDTKKATAETDLDIAEASKAFGWTTCTKTTEAAAEVPAVLDTDGTTEKTALVPAVAAEYSLTTCDGTAATTKFFSDEACSAAVASKSDVVFTYVVACTAGDGDAYDYTVTVNPPAAVDCPTVKATLFEYAASGDKCAADLADKTAAEAAMTWGAKACTNTVEAKAEVPAVMEEGVEKTPLVPAVVGVWSTTTCTEDKVMKVSTWTNEACDAGEASTTYNYGSTDCVDSGTDFSYKLAVEEPTATPEGGEGGEGGAAGEHGVALRAASIAAIALIASQF